MNAFARREIIFFVAVSVFAAASLRGAADPEADKGIEIYMGGKKFDSLNDYRQYQIDRARSQEPASQTEATDIADASDSLSKLVAGLVRNLTGPALGTFDEQAAGKILETILKQKPLFEGDASLNPGLTDTPQPQGAKQPSEDMQAGGQ